MILLWGVSEDSPLRAVRCALERTGRPFLMLDQFEIARTTISIRGVDPTRGELCLGGIGYDLADVTSVYLRPFESSRVLKAADVQDPAQWAHAARFDDAMLLWTELTDALVINRPSAMASNGSKPLQAALIAAAGFDTPRTLLTNDPEAAAEFRSRHGRVIYKSASGVRSRVALLDDAALGRIGGGACPIQLQEYVDGVDLRIHVIGDAVFPCTIESDATDYRYPGDSPDGPRIQSCNLPDDIAEGTVRLTRALGLHVSGIDLRRSNDGRWVCFEVNPSPGYTFYEGATGAPLTEAMCEVLV